MNAYLHWILKEVIPGVKGQLAACTVQHQSAEDFARRARNRADEIACTKHDLEETLTHLTQLAYRYGATAEQVRCAHGECTHEKGVCDAGS